MVAGEEVGLKEVWGFLRWEKIRICLYADGGYWVERKKLVEGEVGESQESTCP